MTIPRDVASALDEYGFTSDGTTGFVARLAGRNVRLTLPRDFPHGLPEICVEESSSRAWLPHVESTGKLCIAATEGLIVDSRRPGAIVRDAIVRAIRILESSGTTPDADAFADELPSYWAPLAKGNVWSLLPPGGPTRAVCLVRTDHSCVVAETESDARIFTERITTGRGSAERAWWFSLIRPLLPPRDLSVASLFTLVKNSLSNDDKRTLAAWDAHPPPRLWLLSCPNAARQPHWVLAARLPPSPTKVEGFIAPTLRALRCARGFQPVDRLAVSQVEASYLLRRVGGDNALQSAVTVLLGVGAIGGYLAASLATLGLGELHLVDPESLSLDNMYRHVLGFHGVETPKALALGDVLRVQYPHLQVHSYYEDARSFLEREHEIAGRARVVVSAIGSPNANMAVSERLHHADAQRIYVWLEANGIGGHVFLEARGSAGCYHCLFDSDPTHGLVDITSFYDPGQTFSRNIAGCSSTFTPFGAIDAQRAALECARLVDRVLRGHAKGPLLVRWREPLAAGVSARLSPIARSLEPGQRQEIGPSDRSWGCRHCVP